MSKNFLWLFISVIFGLSMVTGAFAYATIDNGDFNIPFTVGFGATSDCEGSWCGVEVDGLWTWDSAVNHDDAYNGDYSAYISTGGISSYYTNDFLFYSQDFYSGSRAIRFQHKEISCPDTYFLLTQDCVIDYGYVNNSQDFTLVDTFATAEAWTQVDFNIPDGNYAPALRYNRKSKHTISGGTQVAFKVDTFQSEVLTFATDSNLSVDDTTTFLGETTDFSLTFTEDGVPISGGSCLINVEGSDYAMTEGDGVYTYSNQYGATGNYDVNTTCTKAGYLPSSDSLNFDITYRASDVLVFSDLDNVSIGSVDNDNRQVILNVTNTDDFSFCASSSVESFDIKYVWDKAKDSKQYFAYTSADEGLTYVFNETLTYGSDYNTPLQKVPLTQNMDQYSLDYENLVIGKECFKFAFKDPDVYWDMINSSGDWIHINQPEVWVDDDFRTWDLFSDSNYSNLRSYTEKYYPQLTSSDINAGFELQFTARASAPVTLKVGFTYNGTDSTVDVPLSTGVRRYSIPVNPTDWDSKILFKTSSSSSAVVYATQFAVIPKSYFTDRLNIFKSNGDVLDAILNAGESKQYVKEGVDFLFDTKINDWREDISRLRVEALLGGTVVKTYVYDFNNLTSSNNIYEFNNFLIDGITDLNGNAEDPSTFRSLTVRATAINISGDEVTEQFKTVSLLQYPYFPTDMMQEVRVLSFKLGDNPEFAWGLEQQDPDVFKGMWIQIYDDDSSVGSPDYQTWISNDELNCSYSCFKNIKIDDWVYETAGQYTVNFQMVTNTEYESTSSIMLNRNVAYYVSSKAYSGARILQVLERSDHTYRADEPVPLVLQLKDVPTGDISGDVDVYLTIDICGADTGACDTNGTTRFYPSSHVFDESSGYNYWYFNSLFYDDAGALLGDGNFIRFVGHISDKRASHTDLPSPTLADKCQVAYTDLGGFLMNFITGYGCGSLTPEEVEVSSIYEERLFIDIDHFVASDQSHSVLCVKNDDTKNTEDLKQGLTCFVLYDRAEQHLDYFEFTLGNEYSDYSKDGSESQYLSFKLPAEDIMFNDPVLLQKALDNSFQTDDPIDTIGEIVYYWADDIFSGVGNPFAQVLAEGLTDTAVIKNVNWDVNLDGVLEPDNVMGIFAVRITDMQVVNALDYEGTFPEVKVLDLKNFRAWANNNKIPLGLKETNVKVWASDGKVFENFNLESPLVIYENPSNTRVNQNTLDSNIDTSFAPAILKFNLAVDLVANFERTTQRRSMPLTLVYFVPAVPVSFNDLVQGLESFIYDPVGETTEFVTVNWFWIVILVFLGLIVSLMYANIKSGGGKVEIFNNLPRR